MNCQRLLQGFVASVVILLTACAQSPQKITVDPMFPPTTSRPGNGEPLHVRVSDQRANKVLGSRGGVYRETATFSIANDLSLAVQPPLERHLAALGFNVDSLNPNTVDLHVIFESLVYNHPKNDSVGHDMDMAAIVRVEASRQDGSNYKGRYKVKRNEKFFNAPSTAQNVEKVNALVVEVLENMLDDPQLMSFIRER